MRYLASSEVRVQGPRRFLGKIPSPKEHFQDVAVLAYPVPPADGDALKDHEPQVTCTPAVTNATALADGDETTTIVIPRGAGIGAVPFIVELVLPRPITVRSFSVLEGGQPLAADMVLLVADASGEFRVLKEFKFDRSNNSINVGPMTRGEFTLSLPPTAAKKFRLEIKNLSSRSKAPELAEINLSAAARVEAFVEKQLGKMFPRPLPLWDAYHWPAPAEPDSSEFSVATAKVQDISKHLAADGTLTWDVPPGEWIIQRTGMTPTGTENSPAAPEGRGREVDKMNRQLAQFHFDAFIGELLKRLPAEDRSAFTRVVADSYEMGSQNWTDGFGDEFERRYGYDPVRWFPVLTGRIVGSADQSERFLWDLRRLVADRVATEYVGGLRDSSRRHGLGLWLENYGHWGFPGEFLKYGGESDRVSGEFWVTGELGSIELRAASSCANTYGKKFVSAESFTGGPPFQSVPASLKARGDWSFCEGVNHVVLHVYIQQPWEDQKPGMNAPWGTEFNRHNTWFERGKAWIDYERRACWLLQTGVRVADVAYFIGEDAPKMTGTRNPEQPEGYDFDYINAEVIEKHLTVKNGILTLPHGTTYRVLVLPPQDTMRPEVLRKIRSLIKAGAVVVGNAPSRSPSMEDYPRADAEVRALAAEIWGEMKSGERKFGKGRVFAGKTMAEVFASIGLGADFESEAKLRFTHRREGDTDIYFIANPKNEPVSTVVNLRVPGKAPELFWPESGLIERPAVFKANGQTIQLPLQLEPLASVFVVLREALPKPSRQVVSTTLDGKPCDGRGVQITRSPDHLSISGARGGRCQLTFGDSESSVVELPVPQASEEFSGAWEVEFKSGLGAPASVSFPKLESWTDNADAGIKFYSGTAVYRTRIHLPESCFRTNQSMHLDLGAVRDLGTLRVNGHELATRWLAPFVWDITSVARPGENTIELEVVNPWNNRLVADAGLALEDRKTFLSRPQSVKKDSPLMPAGLLGPVQVKFRSHAVVKFD
jgi:hypothetical protein